MYTHGTFLRYGHLVRLLSPAIQQLLEIFFFSFLSDFSVRNSTEKEEEKKNCDSEECLVGQKLNQSNDEKKFFLVLFLRELLTTPNESCAKSRKRSHLGVCSSVAPHVTIFICQKTNNRTTLFVFPAPSLGYQASLDPRTGHFENERLLGLFFGECRQVVLAR